MSDEKKWFDVHVTESYHARYRIFAEDTLAAKTLVEDMIAQGEADPTRNGCVSYDRQFMVDGSHAPVKGEDRSYWERGKEIGSVCERIWSPLVETRASKRMRRENARRQK